MSSSKMSFEKITAAKIADANIASLSDRPNSSPRYGIGDLSAQELKKRFDAFPELVKEKLNAIISALSSADAAKYITLDGSIGGVDNLYDFLALFCEKVAGGKNVSDYIHVLYAKLTEVDRKNYTLQDVVDDISAWMVTFTDKKSSDYDMIIESDEEFSKCLYPLFKDEDVLSRSAAAGLVADESAINEPSPDFTAKRILVKGVIFKKQRGYDDIRLHIFQPSIEHIRFVDCRWETHWKVSGRNPRDPSADNHNLNTLPERATSFNRATGNLTLTIEGIRLTEQNVNDAPKDPVIWGVGLRNIKSLKDCHIDYPADYRVTKEGYRGLELSCQFFDTAYNCSISGLWDGTNVSDCRVNKLVKRCVNVTNVSSVNILPFEGDERIPVGIEGCTNIVNLSGNLTITACKNIAATQAEARAYADAAKEEAKQYALDEANKKVPIGSPSSFNEGAMVYCAFPNGTLGFKHARSGYNANEIAMRDAARHLYDRPSDYSQAAKVYYASWPKGALIPKDYVDKLVKGNEYGDNGYAPLNYDKKISELYLNPYAPLVNGKIPSDYLPSYVDDVIEGYYHNHLIYGKFFSQSEEPAIIDARYTPESGKIYVDIWTNKSYRWGGESVGYVEITGGGVTLGETSSTAYRGDRGKAAYEHSERSGNPHGTTAENVGAVGKLAWSAAGTDYRVYAQDNSAGTEVALWASEGATHAGADKTIALRNDSGQLVVAAPSASNHAATKGYVDNTFFAKPLEGDMVYQNTYYMPVSRLATATNGHKKVEEFIVTPKEPSTMVAGAVVLRDLNKQIFVPITPTVNGHAASKKYVEDYVAGYARGESFEQIVYCTSSPHFTIPLFSDGTLFRGVIIPVDNSGTYDSLHGGTSFEVYIPPQMACTIHSNVFWLNFVRADSGGIEGYRRAYLEVEVNSTDYEEAGCKLFYFNADDTISAGTTLLAHSYYKVIGKLIHA